MHLFKNDCSYIKRPTVAKFRIGVDKTILKCDAPLVRIKSCGNCLNRINTNILKAHVIPSLHLVAYIGEWNLIRSFYRS